MSKPKVKQRASKLRRVEAYHAFAFITPAVIGLLIFTFIPFILSIIMSLYDWPVYGPRRFVGLKNFVTLFTKNPDFWPSIRNSLVYTIFAVPIGITLSLSLALLLGPRIKGRNAFRVLFFIPAVTPSVANILIWKGLLAPSGFIHGTVKGWFGMDTPNFLASPEWAMACIVIMSLWGGLGGNILIYSAALEQMPEPILEAARIDGATGLTLLFKVIIPLISPALFFTLIMGLIGSIQVFVQVQLLTGGGPGNSTLPLAMFIYDTGFKFHQLGLAAAGAWILFIFIIVITAFQFLAQKKWVHYEN